MSTAISRVNKALRILGASSAINPAQSEMINACFDQLRETVDRLLSVNLDLGIVFPDDPAGELGNPAYSDTALAYQLAIDFAPEARKVLTQEARGNATRTMRQLRARVAPILQSSYKGTLPLGAGNKQYGNGVNFFPETEIKERLIYQVPIYYKLAVGLVTVAFNWDEINPATIASSAWVNTGLTLDSSTIVSRDTTGTLSAGAVDKDYTVINTITLSTGEKTSKSATVKVVSDLP